MYKWFLTALTIGLVGCGDEEKGGDPINGESVYNTSCASCHGFSGEGLSGPPLPGTATDDDIISAIENGIGSMPAGLISGTDVDDVIAYLNTL